MLKSGSLFRLAVTAGLVLVASPVASLASSGGISGFSGNPATQSGQTCNLCHSGGVVPTVRLEGPSFVAPGTVQVYTLTITDGQRHAGGFDVSTTGGTLVVNDPETRSLNGEIVHTVPRLESGGSISWSFAWRVPGVEGTATLYGAGNSVNGTAGSNGDAAAADSLVVTISSTPPTPGETSAEGSAPLLVTAYDPATDELSLTYQPGCGATANNLYYGPLDSVAGYGWFGEACDIGNTGTATWISDPGSYFFVVVGNDGLSEGSYGLDRQPGGTRTERLPFTANLCGDAQDLSNRCD